MLAGKSIDQCYLASDDAPATLHEVTRWLAGQLGAEITSEPVSRFAGSKRCNNKKLKDTGYEFIYPSYKEGYAALIKEFSQ